MKHQFSALTSILVVATLGLGACQPANVEGQIRERTFDLRISSANEQFAIFPPSTCFDVLGDTVCAQKGGTLVGGMGGVTGTSVNPSPDNKSVLVFWSGNENDSNNIPVEMCEEKIINYSEVQVDQQGNILTLEDQNRLREQHQELLMRPAYIATIKEECVADTISSSEFPDGYEPLPEKYRK